MPYYPIVKASVVGLAVTSMTVVVDGDHRHPIQDNGPLYSDLVTGGSTDVTLSRTVADTIQGGEFEVVVLPGHEIKWFKWRRPGSG